MRHCNGLREAGRLGRLVLLTTSLMACSRWQVQSVSPEEVLATQHPTRIRITRADSSKVVLSEPQIVSDTLYGMTTKATSTTPPTGREGVALGDVTHVSVRRSDPVSTGFLIGVPAAALVGAALVIRAYVAGID